MKQQLTNVLVKTCAYALAIIDQLTKLYKLKQKYVLGRKATLIYEIRELLAAKYKWSHFKYL